MRQPEHAVTLGGRPAPGWFPDMPMWVHVILMAGPTIGTASACAVNRSSFVTLR